MVLDSDSPVGLRGNFPHPPEGSVERALVTTWVSRLAWVRGGCRRGAV